MVDPDAPAALTPVAGLPAEMIGVRVSGRIRIAGRQPWWPYRPFQPGRAAGPARRPLTLTAIPYFARGNRRPGAMRVWLPTS
jgi:hypothetical protein